MSAEVGREIKKEEICFRHETFWCNLITQFALEMNEEESFSRGQQTRKSVQYCQSKRQREINTTLL